MKKVLALILAAAVMLCAFTACGSKTGSSGSSEGKVYWLNFKPESDKALQEIAKSYTEQTGVSVQVVTAASGTYQQTLTSEMDKTNAPTLFVVGGQTELDQWSDFVLDLGDTDLYKDEMTDKSLTLKTADGKLAALSYSFECYGIIVNKALLKTAGYEVADIKDFASLKAIAEDIHGRAATLGFDAFTSSGMDGSSSWRFTGHLTNLPLYYEDIEEGYSFPATIKGTYLPQFRAIWDLYINNSAVAPSTLATGGYDAEGEFLNGEAVFYQNGSWEYAALSAKYGDDELAMIPIYIGVDGEEDAGLCSGTGNYWVVNSQVSEADQKATLDFMKWLVTSEEGTAMMSVEFGGVPFKGVEIQNVFLKMANEYSAAGKYNINWDGMNFVPNTDEWRAGLVAAMNLYDQNPSDEAWAGVETAFVAGWARLYAEAHS